MRSDDLMHITSKKNRNLGKEEEKQRERKKNCHGKGDDHNVNTANGGERKEKCRLDCIYRIRKKENWRIRRRGDAK